MTEQQDERREDPRAAIELKVEYKKLNSFFQDYTRNICRGGTFIKTHRPLDVGTEFVFKLTIPDLPEPLILKGLVKWIVTEEQAGQSVENPEPGMGIQFIYNSPDEERSVQGTVERLMKKHLGEVAFSKLMTKNN